jgi:hypothetical protein
MIASNDLLYYCCYVYRANLNFDPPVRKIRPAVQDAGQIVNSGTKQHAW